MDIKDSKLLLAPEEIIESVNLVQRIYNYRIWNLCLPAPKFLMF